jgi:TonB family protein
MFSMTDLRIGIITCLLVFYSSISYAQVSFYNKYFYEIKDTATYEPHFFATVAEDSTQLVKEFFKMDSTIAMRRVDILGEKKESLSTKWIYFDAAGWVSRETDKTYLPRDSTRHTYFYPNGTIKETRLIVNNYTISQTYFDESGQERSVTITDAEPQGGIEAWYEYLRRNLRYPETLLGDDLAGTVRIALELDSSGNVFLFEVMNPENVHPEFQKEALRVVNSFVAKPWQPRMENGIPTEASFVLPIVFKIADDY